MCCEYGKKATKLSFCVALSFCHHDVCFADTLAKACAASLQLANVSAQSCACKHNVYMHMHSKNKGYYKTRILSQCKEKVKVATFLLFCQK